MQYSEELNDVSPEYDDCPISCNFFPDQKAGQFCDSCEKGSARAIFEESIKEQLAESKGRGSYGFEMLQNAIFDALRFEELPQARRTTTAARMINIIQAERSRIVRVKDWKKKVEADSLANRS